jgi:hypothetical protein
LLALALLLPWGVRAWADGYADRLATAVASELSALVSVVTLPVSEADANVLLIAPGEQDAVAVRPAVLGTGPRKEPRRARVLGTPRGVRISAAQVLALASRRAMPQAAPVKASAEHPAGLLLRGVSALGVGLQDGDVLTDAAGQKASSVAVVVGLVLAARGRQVPEISGRFFRAGVPFGLVVEQPYPKQTVPG